MPKFKHLDIVKAFDLTCDQYPMLEKGRVYNIFSTRVIGMVQVYGVSGWFPEACFYLVEDPPKSGYEGLREKIMSEFESTEHEILDEDAGDYGYGGEWFGHPAIDKYALADFVIDLVKKGILKL